MELSKLDTEKMECKDADPEVFFIEGRGSRKSIKREAAIYCGRCVIREECLQVALNNPDMIGIWGGTTEDERIALRRRNIIKRTTA